MQTSESKNQAPQHKPGMPYRIIIKSSSTDHMRKGCYCGLVGVFMSSLGYEMSAYNVPARSERHYAYTPGLQSCLDAQLLS